MIYRVFFFVALILSGCEDDEITSYSITITGIVTDQVTGRPVEGATVSLGVQRGAMPGDGLVSIKSSTSTGADGRYNLITTTKSVKDISSLPIGDRGNSIALVANKSGFIGSDRQEIYYYNAQNSVLNLKLYHSSQLNLHIENDTVNNIDAVEIRVVKFKTYNPMIVKTLSCNKRKLDSVYMINNLWGNWKYIIQVLKPGGQPFSPVIEHTITPIPDITNSYDISF